MEKEFIINRKKFNMGNLDDIFNNFEKKYLHNSIKQVIKEHGPLNFVEISDFVYTEGLYRKRNGGKAGPKQIERRIELHPELFQYLSNGKIGLASVKYTSVKTEIKKGYKIQYGLEPWIDEKSEILILGTLPSKVSIDSNAYYMNVGNEKYGNAFWEIIHSIYSHGNNSKEFILNHRLALWDVFKSAPCKGNRDRERDLSKGEPNKLVELITKYPNIKAIILNGRGETKKDFYKYFQSLENRLIIKACLSSSKYLYELKKIHYTLENQIKDWGSAINIIKDSINRSQR